MIYKLMILHPKLLSIKEKSDAKRLKIQAENRLFSRNLGTCGLLDQTELAEKQGDYVE
jgi:hypothetical protein